MVGLMLTLILLGYALNSCVIANRASAKCKL
jgi:hypothetical protein